MPRLTKKHITIISVAVLVGVVGVVLQAISRAAVATVSFEVEQGALSGGTSTVIDTSAASGKAAKFATPAVGTTPIQRAMVNAPYYGVGLYWPKAGVNFPTTYNTHVQRVGQGKKPDILRTFGSSMTGAWTWSSLQGGASGTSSPTVTGHDGASWHSFKIDFAKAASGSQNAAWTASVNTIPRDGKPKLLTIHHEPENDLPSTNPNGWILNWIKSQIEIGKAVKAAKHPDVLYGPIWMSKYYISDTPRTQVNNLHNFMKVASDNGLLDDLQSVYDFVGWDPYHEGSTKSPPQIAAPRNTAAYWFDDTLEFTEEYFPGKKYAIGETGMYNTVSDAERVAWLKSIKSWVDAHPSDVLAVCYYDASIQAPWYLSLGSGGTVNESYATGAARYWGSLYD